MREPADRYALALWNTSPPITRRQEKGLWRENATLMETEPKYNQGKWL